MSKGIKNIVSDEIFNVYESIRDFLLGDQKGLEELAKIENREEVKNAIEGVTISAAKCLFNVLSLGMASDILETTTGILDSIKGSDNETKRLLSTYDKIVKRYNKQNKEEIKNGEKIRLQTSDEMLDDIYKDSGMSRRNFRLLKNSMTRNFMSISLVKQKQKLDLLEGRLTAMEGRLNDCEKILIQRALEKQTQQQKTGLSDKLKNLDELQLPEIVDITEEQTATPRATEINNDKTQQKLNIRKVPTDKLLDSEITYLRDKKDRVEGANKEMSGRELKLSSQSMPC